MQNEPKYEMLILMKHKGVYYEHLRRNNIPVASYFYVDRQPDIEAAECLWKHATDSGWTKLITKPSWGSCCTMVKCFELGRKREQFFKYVKLLGTQNYPGLTVQEFQWSAADYFEIRTFWIRNEYAYAIGTKSSIYSAKNADDEDCLEITDITTFDDVKMKNGEYGKIDQSIKKQVIDIGRQVVTLPG